MWTKNGKVFLTNYMTGINTSQAGLNFTDINGDEFTVTYTGALNYGGGVVPQGSYATMSTFSQRGRFSLYVGSNNTPATENDYTITPIDLTCSQATTLTKTDFQTVLVFTLTNNTGEVQTINEVGLFNCVYKTSTSDTTPILLNRRVLDNPVVMNPSDTYVFTFTFDTSNLAE